MITPILGWPLSILYGWIVRFRNRLYDKGILSACSASVPVICVGNVTVGGTGKTPVTLELARRLVARGLRVGIVSRGYGRKTSGICEVKTGPMAASLYGDEPALLKSAFPDLPVWVGSHRIKTIRAMQVSHEVDIIVCDDAFQHRALARDLDVVLLDAQDGPDQYRGLPLGRAREPLAGALKRAEMIFLTKSNLVDRGELLRNLNWLNQLSDHSIFLLEYRLETLTTVLGAQEVAWPAKVVLCSAIARPEAFEKMVSEYSQVAGRENFRDHHSFTKNDVLNVQRKMKSVGAEAVVVTRKDAPKLAQLGVPLEGFLVADMSVHFASGVEELNEALDRVSRKNG